MGDSDKYRLALVRDNLIKDICSENRLSHNDEWIGSDDDSNLEHDGLSGAVAIEKAKPRLSQPKMYKVVMLDDDYTPMEFVVYVLQHFFYMSTEQATQIMLKVHTEGKGVCGVYTHDVAETKREQVLEAAHENEHPLLCCIEVAEQSEEGEEEGSNRA